VTGAEMIAMQDTKSLPSPIGIVFNTSMTRPDAALALAAMYVAASRRDARVDGVCVTGAGLDAAIFCDIVARFYTGQNRAPSSNNAIPIGFPAGAPVPPNPAMVASAIARTRDDGSPQYARSVTRPTDTAAPDAMLRNAISFSAEAVVVLSAPATWLARSLALAGTVDQYKERVKRVVIVETADIEKDRPALESVLAALPVPVVRCGRDVGDALSVPRARLESALAWAPAHPVADALRASGESRVGLQDLAAVYYALNPTSEWFSEKDGRLSVADASAAACADGLIALATSRPAPPPGRRGGGAV
jgi:hypothetical protein